MFHCAGVIHPRLTVRELYRVNVEGTRSMIEAAQRAGVRRFVYVSSNAPFGFNSAPGDAFTEASPYSPYRNYGKSKMLAEQIVSDAGASRRIETVIARPCWFHGPGQPARQSRFIDMVRRGTVPIVGDGTNRRSMAYIDNVCQALLLCERVQQANGQAYWIADRRPYSMNEIVETIERVFEKDFGIQVAHRRRRLPSVSGELARWADAGIQALGLYQQEVHVLSEMNGTIACSIDKAERELGYNPTVELEEGMRRSIQWMLAEGILTGGRGGRDTAARAE